MTLKPYSKGDNTEVKKPIYTISASLLNTLLWYQKAKKPAAVQNQREQLEKALKREYVENEHTLRGKKYEAEVYKGEHPGTYIDLEGVVIEGWKNRYVEYGDFIIKVVGKFDIWNPKTKVITDVKCPQKLNGDRYTSDQTTQHLVYLYLEPEAKEFWYSVGYSANPFNREELSYTAFPHYREDVGDLDKFITDNIQTLIQVLYKENLLELYFKNFKVDF